MRYSVMCGLVVFEVEGLVPAIARAQREARAQGRASIVVDCEHKVKYGFADDGYCDVGRRV